jgi:hypothetical protein
MNAVQEVLAAGLHLLLRPGLGRPSRSAPLLTTMHPSDMFGQDASIVLQQAVLLLKLLHSTNRTIQSSTNFGAGISTSL